jgi:hypothetical protein
MAFSREPDGIGRTADAAGLLGAWSTIMKLKLMTVGLLTSALTLVLSADTRAADVRVGVGVQYGGGYNQYGGGYNDTRGSWQYGYARGRDEGYKEGERDARRHERFSFYDEKSYRDCDRGFKGWMGSRGVYEGGYRRGYQEAYTQAFRRFAGYDRYDRNYGGRYDGRYDPRYDRYDRYDR